MRLRGRWPGEGDVRPATEPQDCAGCGVARGRWYTMSASMPRSKIPALVREPPPPFGRGEQETRPRSVAPEACLATTHAELAAQWDKARNGDLTPHDVTFGSNLRVWWRCPEGPDHVWQSTVNNRSSKAQRCPFCQNMRACRDNSLSARFPDLASQWHPTRNGTLQPTDVVPGSHLRVWWLCPVNAAHEWRTTPLNRSHHGTGCPFCARKRASAETSLAFRRPDLAAEWHPSLNGDLGPEMVIEGSQARAWWQCAREPRHVWRANVFKRCQGRGCPFSAGTRRSTRPTRWRC